WIPPDRSFLYGWLIRLFALSTHSLLSLLVAQTLAGAASALLCAFILRRFFAARPAIAALFAILCAIEPLQLLFERYVMTESFSLLAFALYVSAALAYLQRPLLRLLLLVQLAAVLVISFRVSFLPISQAATLLLPLLAWPQLKSTPPRLLRVAAHLLLS